MWCGKWVWLKGSLIVSGQPGVGLSARFLTPRPIRNDVPKSREVVFCFVLFFILGSSWYLSSFTFKTLMFYRKKVIQVRWTISLPVKTLKTTHYFNTRSFKDQLFGHLWNLNPSYRSLSLLCALSVFVFLSIRGKNSGLTLRAKEARVLPLSGVRLR